MDTTQSLQNLYQRFHGFEDRNEFARIFNIDTATFARWERSNFSGKGTNLIKVRVALGSLGYELSDWSFSDPCFEAICELVTFDIIDIKGVAEALDYRDEKDSYRLLLQGHSCTKNRSRLARNLCDANLEKLSVEKTRALHALSKFDHLTGGIPRHSAVKAETQPVSAQSVIALVLADDMQNVFVNLISAIKPLLEYFNDADPEIRKEIRKHVGYAEMSEVAELFRNVSSEKYKEMQSSRRPKGKV